MSIPVPDGYVRDSDAMNSVVMFVPPGQVGDMPGRTVFVDHRPVAVQSLSDAADAMAGAEKMKVASRDARWGGHKAVELAATRDRAGPALAARRAMLVERGGQVFRLVYAARDAHAADLSAYQSVVEGTRWQAVQPPGQGVAARTPTLGGPAGVAFSIPDPFRPDMTRKPGHVLTFLAFDLKTSRPVAQLMVLPFADADPARTLKTMATEVQKNLGPTWRLKGPLRWSEQAGGPVAFATAAQDAQLGTKGSGRGSRVEVLIAVLPDGRASVFTLQYNHGDAAAGMERVLPILRASVRPHARREETPLSPFRLQAGVDHEPAQ